MKLKVTRETVEEIELIPGRYYKDTGGYYFMNDDCHVSVNNSSQQITWWVNAYRGMVTGKDLQEITKAEFDEKLFAAISKINTSLIYAKPVVSEDHD